MTGRTKVMKQKKIIAVMTAVLMTVSFTACSSRPSVSPDPKGATPQTAAKNAAVYEQLNFNDTQENEFAVKGLIDAPKELELKDEKGNVIWSQKAFDFVDEAEKAPETVNPSLWQNTKNNHAYGLFKVIDGIYQVRGYDMANLTLIEGASGWIVFDPLMSKECTEAAMQLVEKNLGKKDVKAVLISHPHMDHFGGIKGVMTAEEAAARSENLESQLASGLIPIIVPEHFEEHAVSENIYAGTAMARRSSYQYGTYLEEGAQGTLAMGIGMGQSKGTVTYISPTYEIKQTGETYMIDGVTMEFQLTPGTEAPAEMNIWIPEKKALWVAENCTGTLHNLYTLRGAEVRDGSAWAGYICEAISRYGDKAEVTFQSHNWPHWGNKVVNDYLLGNAAIYKFINDQTLTYVNQGYTSDEISNMIKLPAPLEKNWYTRQYYGTVAHDAKAVYQKYMGWYDANPVNLNPLPPEESAKKWVEYMKLSGTEKWLDMAAKDYEAGEYQWVAEVTNTIVYAEPENEVARLLCADALEQLGYQAESGTWRNAYLTGAKELRNGNLAEAGSTAISTGDIQRSMTPENIFDYMGILLNKAAMSDKDFSVNIVLADIQQQYLLKFYGGVMLVFKNYNDPDAELSITTAKNALFYFLSDQEDELKKVSQIKGDEKLLTKICSNLNEFSISEDANFNIVEP